jgi:threonine dehydrogenase-like Zn-dependent dehydrogenase
MVHSGVIDPTQILTQVEPMTSVLDTYKAVDQRKSGWVKVELVPGM